MGPRIRLLVLFFCIPLVSLAQKKVSLSGYMRDAETGESIMNGIVFVKEAQQGAETNGYGFYSVSVPPGSYTITYSFIGYGTITQTIKLDSNRIFNAELHSKTSLKEVEVTSRKDANVKNTEMGTISLSISKIKALPVIFGEVDILKALQLLPGVKTGGEGSAGFYVRGGGPDQNLVLLDEAVVYNTGHLFGFFSVFNSDAIKDVTLIKGGMPANYGGRLSSVVDVSMKEGNMKEFHGEGGIGLISSRATIQGPIDKNKGSFMISGRRTYIDILTKPFLTGRAAGTGYYFYDANLKANYILSKNDRVYLSAYLGLDKFSFSSPNSSFNAKIPWGNTTGTLRWNHQFSDKIFVNTSLIYNDYKFAANFEQNDFGIKLSSGVRDWNLKSDLDFFNENNHHFKAGFAYTYHKFIPNQISGRADTVELRPNNALIKYAHEAGLYVQDDFEPVKGVRINAGLRYSWFGQVGPYTSYTYAGEQKIDSSSYGSGQIVKTYGGFEPRLNVRFAVDDASSIKAAITRTYQYIHLVSNNGTTLPTDLWVPSTDVVKPQEAWQYSVGYFRNFLDNKLETSIELYYKDMRNQIEYGQYYVPSGLRDPQSDFVFGKGWSYGAELFINKTQGKFTGWIGYTLSFTNRKFPDLNNGDTYPVKYDSRHDISVVGTYELSKKWTFSGVFVFSSGNAITLPTGYYYIDGRLAEVYSSTNAYRLPPYHRLDLSATLTPQHKTKRKWQGSWTFSVYNVYSRFNPYFMYADIKGTPQSGGAKVTIYEVSIFPTPLPSVTYNFKF